MHHYQRLIFTTILKQKTYTSLTNVASGWANRLPSERPTALKKKRIQSRCSRTHGKSFNPAKKKDKIRGIYNRVSKVMALILLNFVLRSVCWRDQITTPRQAAQWLVQQTTRVSKPIRRKDWNQLLRLLSHLRQSTGIVFAVIGSLWYYPRLWLAIVFTLIFVDRHLIKFPKTLAHYLPGQNRLIRR